MSLINVTNNHVRVVNNIMKELRLQGYEPYIDNDCGVEYFIVF